MNGESPVTQSGSQKQHGRSLRMNAGTASVRRYLLLGVVYLIVAILFTTPLIQHASDHTVLADGLGDQLQTIWTFWWMETALSTSGQSLYWTDAVYFPCGTGLGYDLNPFTGLSAILVSKITGLPINSCLIFNILLLASFVIAGWASYALINKHAGDPILAFLGSLFIVVSPYRLWHLNHLNLLATGWMILTIHFALRFLERPQWKHLVYTLVFFGIMFYSSLTATSHTAVFLLAYVCISARDLLKHPKRRRVVAGIATGIVIAFFIALPGLRAIQHTDSAWNPTWQASEHYSANLLGYIVPSATESMLGGWLNIGNDSPAGWGSHVYLGWFLLVLLIATIVLARRKAPYRWLILAGVFMLLSLGPTLQIGTQRILPGLWPYRWFRELFPYLGLSRAPGRFGVLVQLCLVVFVSAGLAAIIQSSKRQISRLRNRATVLVVVTALVVGVLFVDYGAWRRDLLPGYIPKFYEQLRDDAEIRAIYEGPIASSQLNNYYMYWQTLHGKDVANGYITHHSRAAHTLLDSIWSWNDLGPMERQSLTQAGIDAIVYHNSDGTITLTRLR